MSLKMMLQILQRSLVKNTTMLMYPVLIKKGRDDERKNKIPKTRKNVKKVLLRNTQALLKKSGFKEDEIEEICPNIYGKKAKRIISCEGLVRNDPKIISYLRFIGALTDLSDETVISDIDVQYSDNSSSDSDF